VVPAPLNGNPIKFVRHLFGGCVWLALYSHRRSSPARRYGVAKEARSLWITCWIVGRGVPWGHSLDGLQRAPLSKIRPGNPWGTGPRVALSRRPVGYLDNRGLSEQPSDPTKPFQ